MSKLGKFAAACAAVVCAFGAEAAEVAKYVEYVQTSGSGGSGNQYVLLDYTPTSTSVVEAEIAVANPTTFNQCVFCARGNDTGTDSFTLFWLADGFRWDYKTVNSVYEGKNKFATNSKVSVRCSNSGFWMNGAKSTSINVSPKDYTPANKMMLFASYTCQPSATPAATGNYAAMKLYSFKTYDNDGETLRVDLWPCVDTDGKAGLYDTVTKTIYYSKGAAALAASTTEVQGPADPSRLVISGSPRSLGDVTPAYGTYGEHVAGTTYTLTAPTSWASEDGLTHATCIACTVTAVDGEVVASETFSGEGDLRSLAYTHPICENGVEAVWQWAVENKVTAAAAKGGTVSKSEEWVAEGESFTATAVAGATSTFTRWTDADGNTVSKSAELSVPITAPAAFTAQFGNVYYVAEDGNDENDGTTVATPFRTVQKALDEAGTDEVTTVYVGPGTYTSTVTGANPVMAFTFDKPVHLIATDGPAVTFLNAGTDISRALGKMTHADALVAGFTFKNGNHYEKAKQSGLTASKGVVSNCVFSVRGNWASNGWLLSASGTFRGYDLVIKPFSQNATESNMPFLFDGDSTVDGVVATNCVWTGTPKPILQLNGNAKARNVLVADCTFGDKPVSSMNSLVLLNGAGVVLADSTIAHNTLTAPNGALSIGNAKATVTNCIIAVNSCTGTHPDINNASNMGRCFHSCASDFAADNANGNINVNPQFVDVEHADYHLKPISQAREMGVVALRPSGAADELDCAADADVYTSEAGESLTATFSGYCVGAQGEVTALWDFGDGETSDEWPTVKHTYAKAGRFTVTLTVSDGKTSVSYTIPKNFLAKPAVCYVKEGNEGEFPYDTWEKATPNLKDAYEAGALVIHVTNGTYEIAAPYIDINRKLTLTSVEGPEKTILKSVGGSVDHRHFTVSGSDDIFIAGFAFEGGYANNYSWTAAISMSKGVLSNCVVRKTSRVSRSSALSFSGTAKVYDCIFDGTDLAYNNQGAGTGGILLAGSALLDRCVIQNYKVTSYNVDQLRGPLMLNDSGVVVRNSLVTGCGFGSKRVEKDSGGGVVLVAGTLENCTIVGNSCGGYGGGIHVRGASATIRNCIVWGNTAASEKGADIYSSYAAVVPTCTCAGSFDDVAGGAGEGCTTKDPNFDAEKPYHLTPLSTACIDKAATQDWMTDAADLDRLPRVMHDGPDLGCYEFQESLVVPLDGSIDVTSGASGRLPLAASFEASIVGDETGLEIVWNFGDGTEVAGGKQISHTYTAAGNYPVTAHVSNAKGEEKDLAAKNPVVAVPMTCYVSTTGRNVAPYATWEDAASRIEDAVALNPKTIIVSNGTYKTSGDGIVLSSDIELKSLNGPAVTTIDAQGKCRNVWLTDEQAVCAGFSLTRGYGDWDHSDIAATVAKGTLTNCIVPSISASQYRAPVVRVGSKGKVTGCVINMSGMGGNDNGSNYFCTTLVEGGTIENCEIKNYKWSGGDNLSTPRAALTLTGAAVARNVLVHDCTSTPAKPNGQHAAAVVITGSGTLENCTIADSTGLTGGAGLTIASPLTSAPVVRNCIITGCTAKDGAANPDVRDVNSAAAPRVTYSCSADLTAGEGNVANTNGLFTTRASRPKYSLSPSSPAKNAGVRLDWMTDGATDLIGNPRVFGGKPDMGCYESLSGGLMLIVR